MTDKSDRILLSFIYKGDAYNYNRRSITLERGTFDEFPVFDRLKFTIKGGTNLPYLEFKISNNQSVHYYNHSSDKITTAEIIYLKSNNSKPLAYSVTSNGKTNYYKQSSVQDRAYYRGLPLSPSKDMADDLIEENDKINGTITFRLDKKKRYNNIGISRPINIGGHYNEYKHTPLTTVQYNKRNALVVNNVDGINLKVDFTGDDKIKIQDSRLDSISVYYFDFGDQKDTPLLIKAKEGSKEHFYKPTPGHYETWIKVDIDEDLKGAKKNTDITTYLAKIKKSLFETVYVLIHKQEPYRMLTLDNPKPANQVDKVSEYQGKPGNAKGSVGDGKTSKEKPPSGRNRKSGPASTKSNLNPKNTINVTPNKCKSEMGNYICFQHDLKVHKDPTQHAREEHEIGYGISKDIFVYISNVPINVHILIPGGLAGYIGVSRETKLDQVNFTFLQHIPTLNVFFYSPPEGRTEEGMDVEQGSTLGQTTNPKQKHDHIPLMFNYYKHWFKPRSIDEYFYVWDRVDDLNVTNPINCNPQDSAKIKEHLDEVNRMLNRVNLNYNMNNNSMTATATGTPSVLSGKTEIDSGGTGVSGQQVIGNTSDSSGKYGIPYPTYMNKSYDVNRINVTYQNFQEDQMFISYTHKSINGFGIGTTCYRTKEISKKRKRQADGQQARSGVSFTDSEIKLFEEKSSFNYHNNLKSGLIHGVEEDLDGKVDVTANSVTVYFFNEDRENNYPLLAEYLRPHNEHKYYVLKHGMDNTELVTTS